MKKQIRPWVQASVAYGAVFECDHLNPGSVDPGCDGLKSSQVPFKATSTDNAAGLADAG